MNTSNGNKDNKDRWTARRVLALVGIILLLALYASTLVFALMSSPNARGWFMASIFATFAVPILLYAMIMVADRVKDSVQAPEQEDDTTD